VVPYGNASQAIEFDSPSINILANPGQRLNDICINSSAVLLQHIISQSSPATVSACAIFSTFDLDRTEHCLPLLLVWWMIQGHKYWLKTIWIVPVHRKVPVEHWVVYAILPQHCFILLFNSLADRNSCEHETSVSPQFCSRYLKLTTANSLFEVHQQHSACG
jgi:hypothetical protein